MYKIVEHILILCDDQGSRKSYEKFWKKLQS
jgi:hypothetical protein